MDTKTLTEVTHWMKNTDLTEVVYRKNGSGFELRTESALPQSALPSCALVPVGAPAVGIYRGAGAGKSAAIHEGAAVKEGAELGYIELSGEKRPVKSPVKGFLRVVCAEDGKPAQYGQPLFFIEPQ